MPLVRCGFVAVCGKPNAGKSRLVNTFVGQSVSIVTPKAQTTRNRITAIRNDDDAQVIFMDTPGLVKSTQVMNEYLDKIARRTAGEADVILFVVDCSTGKNDPVDLEFLKATGCPVLLALNKIDLAQDKSVLLPLINKYAESGVFKEIFPISAKSGEGIEQLYSMIVSLLPEQERLFPADWWSDMPEKFFAAEIIRGSVFMNLREELPYSSAVEIEVFDEAKREGGLVKITASIHVERNSQKGMVIGKGGEMLKKIGTRAREDLEKFLGTRVYLELNVKITKNWTKNPNEMKKLGYFERK